MEGMRHVTGKEILQSVSYAKSQNPKDPYGENAFQIDITNIKETDMVRYVPVNINVFCGKDEAGKDKWEFIPFNVRFRKVTTKSKISTYDERKNSKIKSVTLQFRNISKGYWKNLHTGKEEEDPIGEALVVADTIIRRKIARLLKAEKLYNQSTDINMFVQRDQRDKKTGKVLKTFDEQLIRMEIKFRKPHKDAQNVEPDQTPWLCDIYDATRPRPAKETPEGEPAFYPATIDVGEGETVPINYGNIHTYIRAGSSITGFLNISQISLSKSGISLTPRFSSIIVKKSAGFKPNFAAAMAGQLDDLADAAVETPEIDDEGDKLDTTSKSDAPKKANAEDFGDDLGDLDETGTEAGGDDDIDDLPDDLD